MTGKSIITIKQVLSLDADPMDIDVSEFEDLAKSMPLDGNVDLATASKLAAKYLRGADRCSEVISHLVWCVQKCRNEKRRARSLAYLRSKESDTKMTDTMANHKAECDNDYISACDDLIGAEAVKEYFEGKHQSFLDTHRLMKERIKSEIGHQRLSGFSETTGTNGEGNWE